MKKLLMMSAILVLAACGEKPAADAPPAETSEMAAPADTGMGGMSHDSAAMAPSDTTMARDTAK